MASLTPLSQTLKRREPSTFPKTDHVFLSFSCLASASGSTSDTIDFKHAPATLDLKAIRSRVAPCWPYGMDVKDSRDDAASASGASGPGESAVGMKTDKKVQERRLLRFYGNPWAARGEDGVA